MKKYHVILDGKVAAVCDTLGQVDRAYEQVQYFGCEIHTETVHIEHDDEWCSGDASYDGENEPDYD